MQKLEKILERLGAYICDDLCCHRYIGTDKGDYAMQEICEKCELGGYLDDIRKRLSCENSPEIMRLSRDSDWIPVSERLPEEKINPASQDFYEYQVTARFGIVTDVRHYKFGNGHWWHGSGIVDQYVIAWRPLPEPYRPASKTPEEMQEWKERMLRNFLRGHKTIRG